MIIQNQVGTLVSTTSLSDGSQVVSRAGKLGDLIVSELQGRFYEQTYRRNTFIVSNQAVVSSSAALTTTFTGLLVGNPTTSLVNLVLLKAGCAQVAVGAAAAVGIMTGTGASVTASLTPRNRYVGGASANALSNAGQTLPGTPVLEQVYGTIGSLATTGYGLQQAPWVDLDGSLILPPGAFAASYTTVATTSALIFYFMWCEVPI